MAQFKTILMGHWKANQSWCLLWPKWKAFEAH